MAFVHEELTLTLSMLYTTTHVDSSIENFMVATPPPGDFEGKTPAEATNCSRQKAKSPSFT